MNPLKPGTGKTRRKFPCPAQRENTTH